MGCTSSKSTPSKSGEDWYYEKTDSDSSQSAKKNRKKLSSENVKSYSSPGHESVSSSVGNCSSSSSNNHDKLHCHHMGSNGGGNSEQSVFTDRTSLDLPYIDDDDDIDIDSDKSPSHNVPPINIVTTQERYTLDHHDDGDSTDSGTGCLNTPSPINRQYTSPVFRTNRGLTASQAEFFRVLDEKIEQGQDYYSDIDT